MGKIVEIDIVWGEIRERCRMGGEFGKDESGVWEVWW